MNTFLPRGPFFAFGPYTNAAYMQKVWSLWLPTLLNRPVLVDACFVRHARCRCYLEPSSWLKSYMGVCYEFNFSGEPETINQPMLYGKVYLDGNSRLSFENIINGSKDLENTSGAQYIPELDMIVWNFPDDPGMPHLASFLEKDFIVKNLPYEQLPIASYVDIVDIRVKVIRYRPEQRCILRYDIFYGAGADNIVLYAKVFEDDKGEWVFSYMQQSYELLDAVGYRSPKALHYNAEIKTVWLAELYGLPLMAELYSNKAHEIFADIGQVLACLHTMVIPMQKSVTREERLFEMTKKANKLAQAFPAFSDDLAVLLQRMESDLATLSPILETMIHGDVHIGQFLLMPDKTLAILDFDGCSHGDPAQDLADFIVDPHLSLFERSSKERNRVLPAECVPVLLSNYRKHAPWLVDDLAIVWHMRVQLINKAYRAAITQEPNWQEKIPELIVLSARNDLLQY